MNPIRLNPEKALERDLKTFERLPVKTRELNVLMDLAEKTTGSESKPIQDAIRKKSK